MERSDVSEHGATPKKIAKSMSPIQGFIHFYLTFLSVVIKKEAIAKALAPAPAASSSKIATRLTTGVSTLFALL